MAVHRIRRQRLQLKASSQDDAFALRETVRERVAPAVTHALERVFDELGPDSDVVHLDRLAIAIRLTGDAEEAHALEDVVLRQVRAQVSELIGPAARERTRGRVRRETAVADRFERLMRYLHDGLLSWSDIGGGRLALVDELEKTLDSRLDEVVERWRTRSAMLRVGAIARLLQLLPESDWSRVIALAAASDTGALQAIQSVVRSISNRHQRITLAAVVVAIATRGGRRLRVSSSMEPGFLDTGSEIHALVAELPAETREYFQLADELPPDAREYVRAVGVGPPREVDAALPVVAEWAIITPAPIDNDTPLDADVGVLVEHAGLILIHGFLPQLFRALRFAWRPDGGFDPNDANRAAAALVYAATGAEEALAFELAFVRTLINARAEQAFVISAGVLSEADRAEVDAMLHAVIGHWPALGKTSVDGFRRAFLQRPGLLDEIENGYRLRMQVESFDVLLNQLPWSIATVRLPSMDRPIFTEWLPS